MARASKQAGAVAPNVAYTTFKQWLSGLKGVVPAKIDNTLFRGQSGSTVSQLRGALAFLRLVDHESVPTSSFAPLASAAGQDDWPVVFKPVVEAAYAELLGGLNGNATRAQLLEAFRDRGGVSGETAQKAARFYVSAATECGIEISPFWRSESGDGGGARPRRRVARRAPAERQTEDVGKAAEPQIPPGAREYKLRTKHGEIVMWIPVGMTETSWDRALDYLRQELLEFVTPENPG
ncbi:MAG: hypothetical protein MUF00_20405 [Gemmatimonadaceae bacterium]|jgi:hypothetical protein|nr:hypothetical protein [Gemmatimonadaceae bacterium]